MAKGLLQTSSDVPHSRLSETPVSRRRFIQGLSTFTGAAIVAPGLLAQACASPNGGPAGSVAKSGGTLKAAVTGTVDTFDPAVASNYTSWQIYWNIFSSLIQVEPDGRFTGVLAKSWTSPDPNTYIFDLRDDVYFHNGEKFSANDVKYTIDRVLNSKAATSFGNLFSGVASAEIASPTQVVFHLKNPFGAFFINLAQHLQIVNQRAVESIDPARTPIGTGPFKFVERTQDHVTIQKFDKYFIPNRPYLDKVIFQFRLVDESRILGLRSGDLDWVDGIPLQDTNNLKSDSAFRLVTSTAIGVPGIMLMQCVKPPFNNKALRQAVGWAIDRKAVADVAYFGTGQVGGQEFGSGSPWNDGVDPFPNAPDLAKARAKLAEAGVGQGLKVECLTLPNQVGLAPTALVVQQNLKAIGIDMKITELEVAELLPRYQDGDFQLLTANYTGHADPDPFWDFEAWGKTSWERYSNPNADSLILQARAATDFATRKSLYAELRKVIADDAPMIFVHFNPVTYLMNKNVVGSAINLDYALRLENVGFSA
jgi:peptide/nickel transport system substrate-binding protein